MMIHAVFMLMEFMLETVSIIRVGEKSCDDDDDAGASKQTRRE